MNPYWSDPRFTGGGQGYDYYSSRMPYAAPLCPQQPRPVRSFSPSYSFFEPPPVANQPMIAYGQAPRQLGQPPLPWPRPVSKDENRFQHGINGSVQQDFSRPPPQLEVCNTIIAVSTDRKVARARSPPSFYEPVAKKPVTRAPSPVSVTMSLESMLFTSRKCRPEKILLLVRGLPGSGKSILAQRIKSRELELCQKEGRRQVGCRVLSLDDYFMIENDKTGELEFQFDSDSEANYQRQLVKSVCTQMDSEHYNFLIAEGTFQHAEEVKQLRSEAQRRGYSMFVLETTRSSLNECIEASKGRRTQGEFEQIHQDWQRLPGDFFFLDCAEFNSSEKHSESHTKSRTAGVAVESMDKRSGKSASIVGQSAEETADPWRFVQKSKWETNDVEVNMKRLDGLKRGSHHEYHLPNSNDQQGSRNRPNRKGRRVTWGDVELLKRHSQQRQMGFVIGKTDWRQMVDPSRGDSQYSLEEAEKALVKIHYI